MKIKEILSKFTLFLNKGETRSQLLKDGVGSVIVNVANKILTLIIGIILVRVLGKSDYGTYSYVFSIVQILLIPTEFGVTNLIVRETANSISLVKYELANGVLRWSFKLVIITSSLIIVLAISISALSKSLFSVAELNTLFWGLSIIPFYAIIHLIGASLRGQKKIVVGQIPDLLLLPGFFSILLFLTFLFDTELSFTGAMVLRSFSTIFASLISVIIFIAKTPSEIISSPPITLGSRWRKSAISMGLSSGLNTIRNKASIILMGFFVSSANIGVFQVAISTAALSVMILEIINSILAPQFASLYTQNHTRKLQRVVTFASRVTFICTLLISIIFIIFGRNLLTIVFGDDLIDAYPTLIVLLLGQIINSYFGSVGFLLNMTGHEKEVMKAASISTFINLLLVLVLTQIWGNIGTAIAMTISLVFSQIVMSHYVKKFIGISSRAF